MSPQKKKQFSYEIQIQVKNAPEYYFKDLKIVPQVHYLRDGHYHVDFGIQQLFVSDVRGIVIVGHETEVELEPVVTLPKETK